MDAHKNFAYSTVAGAPSPATSGTSLTLSTGEGALMPTTPFNAMAWPANVLPLASNAEIVRVTNRVSDVLTITRAQESTSAKSIAIGWQFAAGITAKTLTDIEAAVATIVTDHGALSGLADDDHPQYLKERASGGAESEVPGHDHTATAKGGAIALWNSFDIVVLTNASDNWTVPAGTVEVLQESVGPGAGGGGADNDNAVGGGGGAGEYARKKWTVAALGGVGASVAYTNPSGGGGGSTSGGNGSNGAGETTFNSIGAAPGNGGGGSTSAVAGRGGLGGTGGTGSADLRVPGQPGQPGTGDNVGDGMGGTGGSSPFGSGGRGGYDDGAGEDGLGHGSGGGGAAEDDGTGQAGGAGTAGQTVLTVYKRV